MTRYLATGFHAPERGTIEPFTDALIEVEGGTITAFRQPGSDHYDARGATRLPHILLPGFVDLHIHAPQYPQLGTALDVPLEDWLHRYTFPLEARYADLNFAQKVYHQLVTDLLASGTTTALYFATLHVPATKALADICHALGQRALIGKVVMDHPENCPDDCRDGSTAEAVAGTQSLIDHIRALPGDLIHPVVTPRFIPACTDETLAALGQLAQATGTRVQTHVSESDWEHGYVLDRHGVSDTESLRRLGLLTPGSVLAHGPHLSPQDMQTLCDHRTGVAHCPLSNAYFAGAVFPLRAALEKGLRVGLGSDISGGPAGTIWEAARMAVAASRMLETGTNPALPADRRGLPGARIDMATAFYLATTGGGQALDLPVGYFAPGMAFDAMQIDPLAPQGTIRLWGSEPPAIRLERLIYTASRANIARVWVAGRPVHGAA